MKGNDLDFGVPATVATLSQVSQSGEVVLSSTADTFFLRKERGQHEVACNDGVPRDCEVPTIFSLLQSVV